jgi:hypothetical protein
LDIIIVNNTNGQPTTITITIIIPIIQGILNELKKSVIESIIPF